jgi:RNA polymerase sigma-70 factor, ECF subfamily
VAHFVRTRTDGARPELVREAVARAKAGDVSAVHFLYVRFADEVFGHVRSIVADGAAAEDITQTVFAKLGAAIQKYEPRQARFSAWLLRVARNAALAYLRARRQLPLAQVRTEDRPDQQLCAERLRALRAALARLPPAQREVLVLRHLVGLSPVEIAERLGKTERSIHGLHDRGRSALQPALRELEAAPSPPARSPKPRRRASRETRFET